MKFNSKQNSQRPAIMLGAILLGSLVSGTLLAHKGATGVVKDRMTVMSSVGKDMKKIGAMIKGEEPFDAVAIAGHAESIQSMTPDLLEMFPEDSIFGPSEALPVIWENWDEFSALFNRMTEEVGKLQKVSSTEDRRAITMQFAKVGKVCSSCHTDYRKKKEE